MNGQLPPIDSDIRAQLTRRSAGRVPEGLLAEVSAALDRAPTPRARGRLQLPTWRSPRLAAAGMGLALVAILAVAVAFPALNTTPAASLAGYPANRALTTAELAALMAGPRLASDTTLVASVTIDSRWDVCPMNSYPTVGVIEGMRSQVCVMGGTLQARFSGASATGVFAFRYMGPGYLGLLGQITPASTSKLAFRVTDNWPLTGETFLAEGFLGADAIRCTTVQTFPVGDPFDPSGYEPCQLSWLSEDGSPVPLMKDQTSASPADTGSYALPPDASVDLLALHEKARYVAAGGARQIDAIPNDTTRGVFVVRQATGPCPGASPIDNRGCRTWVVLARVAGVSLPETTTPPPSRVYPTDRALTTAELTSLLAGLPLATNATLVVEATIDVRNDVCPMNRYQTVGVLHGVDPQVCVMGSFPPGQIPSSTAVTGTFAFRYLGLRSLGFLGQITPAASRLAFHVTDDWPLTGQTFLVEGWLGATQNFESCIYAPTAGDVLLPDGDSGCGYTNWLSADGTPPVQEPPTPTPDSSTAGAGAGADAFKLYGKARLVQAEGVRIIDSIDHASPTLGAYVVRSIVGPCPGDPPQSSRGCGAWRVLAKVADVPLPQSSPLPVSPTPPAPTPTIATAPITPPDSPLELLGGWSGGLTESELTALMAADPSHLAGRVAILQAPFGSGIVCDEVTPVPSPLPVVPCATLADLPDRTGIWAVLIGSDGMFDFLGQVAPNPTTNSGTFVHLPAEAYAAWKAAGEGRELYVVYGWLLAQINVNATDLCDLASLAPGSPCPPHDLVWLSDDGTKHDLPVAPGDYELPRAGDPVNNVYPAVHGYYLVQMNSGSAQATVLARFGPATPAGAPTPTPATPAPPATPVALPTGSLGQAPLGLLGSGDRPLTSGEFATLWAADPARLAGRIVIVKGPVPTGFFCWSAGAADAGISPPPCHIAVLDGQIAADGHYWVVQVGSDGKLSVVAELSIPQTSFVFTLDQFVTSAANSGDRFLIVDAWLD